MNHPTIDDAKCLAKRYRKSGTLIMSIGGGTYSIVSYGMTPKQCIALRRAADRIEEMIAAAEIDLSEFRFDEKGEDSDVDWFGW